MKPLNFELKEMCQRSSHSSHATRTARSYALQQAASQIQELGYKLKSPHGIKPKHIHALVTHWKDSGISTGAVKNRMSHVRWWVAQVGKKSILEDNEGYGIGQREPARTDRAKLLKPETLAKVECAHVRAAVSLQAAFGLRREEAIKFRPSLADQGDHITLKGSWCKGGRPRSVPITTKEQRALLNAVHQFAGDGSLIPAHKSYKQQLDTYKHQTLKAGLTNLHGLRHQYAQDRHAVLSQQNPDHAARLAVSRELGHNRVEITRVYLGS